MTRKKLFRKFRTEFSDVAPAKAAVDEKKHMPQWLTKMVKNKPFMHMRHIHLALNHNESRLDSKVDFARRDRIAKTASPSRSEVGMFAMDIMYHRLVQMFTIARKGVKKEFFNMIGYLFVEWDLCKKCPVHNSTVNLTWAAPLFRSHLDTLSTEETPRTMKYLSLIHI